MIAESGKFEAFIVGAVKNKVTHIHEVKKIKQQMKQNTKKDHEDSLFESDSIGYVVLSHK